jgi:ubiquinone biosynthesis protein
MVREFHPSSSRGEILEKATAAYLLAEECAAGLDARIMILESIRSAVDFATHLPRYREIVRVLFKYGFAEELRLAALERLLNIDMDHSSSGKGEILSKPLPERVRLALEELGPTFVKFGQILSSRRDLINDDFYCELEKLQSEVPPFPSEEAVQIIERELSRGIDELFSDFSIDPIGGASIAQVHRARLLDGTDVAVKVQRPDILHTIEMDLAILVDLAKFVEKHVPEIAALNPVGIVQEFAASLMRELDFRNEASNAERFRSQFEDDPRICVPRVYFELSTDKVLTMQFISGIRITNTEELDAAGIDRSKLAINITELIFAQIFEHGFFHGDPHPGNLTILPGGVVGLYDYGMMGTFSPEFRLSVAHMISGLAERNHRTVMRSILEMSEEGYPANPQKMLSDVEAFADEHLNRPLREINLGKVLNKLLELLRNNRLRMKSSFYMGIKALTQVEAIGRELDPGINFVILGEPYALGAIAGRYAPKRLAKLLQRLFTECVDFLEEFPHDFRTVYQRVKRGDVNIPLQHKIDPQGFEPLRKTLDSIANRLTNAILAASVLVCSSILILANVPPHLFGISAMGFFGLIFGLYMCLRLVLSIWKHGGL